MYIIEESLFCVSTHPPPAIHCILSFPSLLHLEPDTCRIPPSSPPCLPIASPTLFHLPSLSLPYHLPHPLPPRSPIPCLPCGGCVPCLRCLPVVSGGGCRPRLDISGVCVCVCGVQLVSTPLPTLYTVYWCRTGRCGGWLCGVSHV